MITLQQPLSHVVSKFILEGTEYDVEHFKIRFSQPTDYKGQPQHETKGGQIQIVISQAPDDLMYDWGKRSTKLKDGVIVFQTQMSSPVLRVEFEKGYCVSLLRNIDEYTGSTTTLVIAPECVKLNGKPHTNFWKK